MGRGADVHKKCCLSRFHQNVETKSTNLQFKKSIPREKMCTRSYNSSTCFEVSHTKDFSELQEIEFTPVLNCCSCFQCHFLKRAWSQNQVIKNRNTQEHIFFPAEQRRPGISQFLSSASEDFVPIFPMSNDKANVQAENNLFPPNSCQFQVPKPTQAILLDLPVPVVPE